MRKNQIINVFINIFLLIILPPFMIFADWSGPKEIITGTWGKEIGQFYYQSQDTEDSFPRIINIDKYDNIIIPDKGNRRIYIYKQSERLLKIIQKPAELPDSDIIFGVWPNEITLMPYNNCIIYSCEYKSISGGYQPARQCVMDYNGKIISKIEIAETFVGDESVFLFKNNKYYSYSPNGNLLRVHETKPLELGIIRDERKVANNKKETTIEFPDYTYKIITNYSLAKYSRDILANLYSIESYTDQDINCYRSIRLDRCNGDINIFNLPKSEYGGYGKEGVNTSASRPELLIMYGEPIISPKGDMYCWAITKTHYKILKWTWQGPEDAPQSLKISSGMAGLKLNWGKPVKDVETVTGYQILRSAEVCGPFTEVTILKKDKLSFEDTTIKPPWKYYYVVKAVRDKKYSGESNKVYMQWK